MLLSKSSEKDCTKTYFLHIYEQYKQFISIIFKYLLTKTKSKEEAHRPYRSPEYQRLYTDFWMFYMLIQLFIIYPPPPFIGWGNLQFWYTPLLVFITIYMFSFVWYKSRSLWVDKKIFKEINHFQNMISLVTP